MNACSFQWAFRGRENQSGAIWSWIDEMPSSLIFFFSNFTNKQLHAQKLWSWVYFVFYALSRAQSLFYSVISS